MRLPTDKVPENAVNPNEIRPSLFDTERTKPTFLRFFRRLLDQYPSGMTAARSQAEHSLLAPIEHRVGFGRRESGDFDMVGKRG
jgi:hypothetical protein